MAQEWNIRPRSGQCSACQVAFSDGQPYYTRLTFEAADYSRGDYCEPCWASESTRQSGYSSWRGVFRSPPPVADHRIKKETAENLLRGLMAKADPSYINAVYILAVMLERQRVFVEREVREDNGARRVIYEHRKTGETFAIIDPQLKLHEIDSVQREIMALLNGNPIPATA